MLEALKVTKMTKIQSLISNMLQSNMEHSGVFTNNCSKSAIRCVERFDLIMMVAFVLFVFNSTTYMALLEFIAISCFSFCCF